MISPQERGLNSASEHIEIFKIERNRNREKCARTRKIMVNFAGGQLEPPINPVFMDQIVFGLLHSIAVNIRFILYYHDESR